MSRLADCYRFLKRRLYVSGQTERAIIDDFHRLYHQVGRIEGSWGVTWRGRPVAQNPMDLMAIARIIQEQKKPPVLEIGTGTGGSALFYRDVEVPAVVTIDLAPPRPFRYDGHIHYIQGDSTAISLRLVRDAFRQSIRSWRGRALVILDGDHHAQTVSRELQLYSSFVPIGGYLIVCDTHFNGHPIAPEFGPGPWEAVEEWLPKHPEFVRDRSVEPMLTFNPGGYLKRVT